MENFPWIDFYVKFAEKLYEYKDNRGSLVQILNNAFYDKDKEIFKRVLERNDIDPFTVFASFNAYSGENRIEYINRFINAFEMDGSIIPNNFDGVPSAQPLQKRYYDHDSTDVLREVQNLWDMFVYSINYANDKTDENERLFCESFDVVKGMRGIGLRKLTEALFWIRPNDFMTLDANSFGFLKREYGIVDSENIDGKDYLKIIEECDIICKNEKTDFNNFPELSHFAYCARKNEIRIWKISHGILTDEERNKLKERNAISMSKNTAALASSKKTQGEIFTSDVKKGDYFYLCYGSEIVLIGKITSEAPIRNVDKTDDWIEYTYEKIRDSKSSFKYNGKKTWWTPNNNSTFYEVKDQNLFEELILKPYFDMSLSDLIEPHTNNRKDENHMNKNIPKINLNTILYGPPGTGKTYHTVVYAVAICNPSQSLDELKAKAKTKDGYAEILEQYNKLVEEGKVVFTTFHQSYGYEDFIEGIKPKTVEKNGKNDIAYDVEPGVFKQFCLEFSKETEDVENFDRAWNSLIKDTTENTNKELKISLKTKERTLIWEEDFERFYVGDYSWKGCFVYKEDVQKFYFSNHLDGKGGTKLNREASCSGIVQKLKNEYNLRDQVGTTSQKNKVFIIDEINRGNISKIFGELITLIEDDKRDNTSVTLPYSGEKFTVPENVYILGTMNTADRSITALDTALRRRFSFVEMMPEVDVLNDIVVEGVKIKEMLAKINERIELLFDREHTIGHAYFAQLRETENQKIEALADIFKNKIVPLLQEYFYEDYSKIRLVLADNQVDNTNFQFIIKEEEKNVEALFGDSDIDVVSDLVRYEINEDAFKNAKAYIKIYQKITENNAEASETEE